VHGAFAAGDLHEVAQAVALGGVEAEGVGECVDHVLALAFLSLRAQDAIGAGALSAMAQSIGYLVAAVGPVVFGLLHSLSSGWHVPVILLCAAAAGQAVVAMAAGRGTVRPADGQAPDRVPSLPLPGQDRAASPGR
jgi:CP family cyanate transporter-like MFS transporter